jgi:Tfp pilus assembly protein FimT
MTVQQLILALAQQLGPILPAGVTADADERNVIIHTRWGRDWLNLADNIEGNTEDGTPLEEVIESVVNNQLESLSQMVTYHLATPWPQMPGMGRSQFASAWAEMRDGILTIRFGAGEELLFPPIRIDLR